MLITAVLFPPAVSQDTADRQRGKSQVNDPGIEGFARSFTQLLGGPGADGALCTGLV